MKCKMFLLALSAMALATGCSNDETTELNKGNAIEFSVTAGKLTRSQYRLVTTSNISQFAVSAVTDNTLFMDQTPLQKDDDDKWIYKEIGGKVLGTKYWPETHVDFYAYSPINLNTSSIDYKVTLTPEKQELEYTVNGGEEDLLYATNKGEEKENHKTTPVEINFRHAMSQILFKAKLTANSSIDVEIEQITVKGVTSKGTLRWPVETTKPNLVTKGNDTEDENTWGTWKLDNSVMIDYDVLSYGSENIKLDESNTEAGPIGHPLFLLPQKLNPWLTVDGENVKATGTARLLVNCKITDRKSGLQLWPKEKGKYNYVAISLDNPKNDPCRDNTKADDPKHDKWMQGKKYIYTLIFGEGGGYTTDPDNPKPVLVPITFDVTVDEFQNGGSYDLNANK